MTLRLGSLFAGVGGFDLGFERAGFATAWAVEIDPKAQAVLRRRFPAASLHSDVREVGASNLGPVDVVTFGSPCQDLSVAGKRAGLAGGRSGLFHEATRVIRELRDRYGKPDLAIWENVPGAFSSNEGHDFTAVLRALADIGAVDIGWRVLDSRWFGVAQRRRRILLVADFRAQRSEAILALEKSGRRDTPSSRKASKVSPGGAREGVAAGGGERGVTRWPARVAPTIDADFARHYGQNNQHVNADCGLFVPSHPPVLASGQANATVLEDGTVPTLTCLHEVPLIPTQPTDTYCAEVTSALCAADGPKGVSDQYAHEGKLIATFVQPVADPLSANEQKTYTHEGTFGFRTRNVQAFERAVGVTGDQSHALLATAGRYSSEDGTGRGVPIVATAPTPETYALEIRGRNGERELEWRADGTANCLRTPNGGRDGLGVGAVTAPGSVTVTDARGIGDGSVAPTLRAKGSLNDFSPIALQDVRGLEKAQNGSGWNDEGAAYTVDTMASQGVCIPHEPTAVAFTQNDREEVRLIAGDGSITGALNAQQGSHQTTYVATVASPAIPMVNMQGGKGMAHAQADGPSFSLQAMHGHDVHAVLAPTLTASNDPSRSPQSAEVTQQVAAVQAATSIVRRLTPVECCRLQGFPDDWNVEGIMPDGRLVQMPDSARYKQMGNAVTVNVAEYLARRIAPLLAQEEESHGRE